MAYQLGESEEVEAPAGIASEPGGKEMRPAISTRCR
ncbi:MAG: hypothetical protein LZF60_280058 [Nitrospira sp.]|nr:MAG: hypothetical protein LZF60_280058 [Nitrospira sp.]